LYGFATPEEKQLSLPPLLLSGIGPKIAMTILSGTSPEQFRRRILDGDVESLTLIPGIGLKTARRIIVELGEKIGQTSEVVSGELATVTLGATGEEALRALISLGYRRAEALNALRKAVKELGDSAPVEKYIKAALNQM